MSCYQVGSEYRLTFEQTPTPARRFLPPSSSSASSSKHDALFSNRPAFRTTQGSQAYASTQASRFQNGSIEGKDEIDTSFGEDDTSTGLTTRHTATQRRSRYNDISDDSQELSDKHESDAYDEGSSPNQNMPRFRSTGLPLQSTKTASKSDDITGFFEDLDSPPPRKRRKHSPPDQGIEEGSSDAREHLGDNGLTESHNERYIPSALSATDDDMPDGARKGDRTDQESPEISPIAITTVSTRFRIPNHFTEKQNHATSRPSFRPSLNKSPASVAQAASTYLPQTFSPSRRRGKQGYVPGGAAEKVRNWVLDLAAEESQAADLRSEIVQVRQVQRDRSRRCLTVITEDETKMLLVAQQGKGPAEADNRRMMSKIGQGSQIVLKGAGTRWALTLGQHGGASADLHKVDVLNVYVLWDVLDAGEMAVDNAG